MLHHILIFGPNHQESEIPFFDGSWYTPYTLWLFNMAMLNDPFIDDFPIKTSIYKGFSMAMLNNQMVHPPCNLTMAKMEVSN